MKKWLPTILISFHQTWWMRNRMIGLAIIFVSHFFVVHLSCHVSYLLPFNSLFCRFMALEASTLGQERMEVAALLLVMFEADEIVLLPQQIPLICCQWWWLMLNGNGVVVVVVVVVVLW
jgi:hypothetical protein